MFDSSAKKPAVGAHGKGFYWQPLGPYTCSLGEAGVCVCMWRVRVHGHSLSGTHSSCLQ